MANTFTSKSQNQVKEFHVVFKHPVSSTPVAMGLKRAIDRSVWTGEEIVEFIHASSSNETDFNSAFNLFMQGMQNAYDKSLNDEFITDGLERVVAQADALADAKYFIDGSSVEIGVDIQKVTDIVQEANLSKLFTDENGNKYPKYREDGKILKSPEFFTPETKIKEEIVRQITK